MAIHLLIKDGVVVNRIEYDGVAEFAVPDGHVLVKGDGGIGHKWDAKNGVAIDPNPAPLPAIAAAPARGGMSVT